MGAPKTMAELEAELAEKVKALEAAEARGTAGDKKAAELEVQVSDLRKELADLKAAQPHPSKPAPAPAKEEEADVDADDDELFLVL